MLVLIEREGIRGLLFIEREQERIFCRFLVYREGRGYMYAF